MIVAAYDIGKYVSPRRVYCDKTKKLLDEWITISEFEVFLTDGRVIRVPPGFVYDKGSVPRLAWAIIPRDDRFGVVAFLVHDYLYVKKETTRKEADQIMYELLRSGGMSWIRSKLAHNAVWLGGWIGWNRN